MELGLAHDRRDPGSVPLVLRRSLSSFVKLPGDRIDRHIVADLLAGLQFLPACSDVFLPSKTSRIVTIAGKPRADMGFLNRQVRIKKQIGKVFMLGVGERRHHFLGGRGRLIGLRGMMSPVWLVGYWVRCGVLWSRCIRRSYSRG